MPRKTDNKEPRSRVLPPCRVTETERDGIKSKARNAGVSLSEYQRRACLETVVVVRENAIDAKAVLQLSALGNNVNQIARKLNVLNDNTPSPRVAALVDRLEGIIGRVETAVDELIDGS